MHPFWPISERLTDNSLAHEAWRCLQLLYVGIRSKVASHPTRRRTRRRPDKSVFSPTEHAYISCLVHPLTKVKVQIEHCTIDSRSEKQAICKTTLTENRAAIVFDRLTVLISRLHGSREQSSVMLEKVRCTLEYPEVYLSKSLMPRLKKWSYCIRKKQRSWRVERIADSGPLLQHTDCKYLHLKHTHRYLANDSHHLLATVVAY